MAAPLAEKFGSLDRASHNNSEMNLKLPDIKQTRASRDQSDLSINYTDDRRERLRAKLENLYSKPSAAKIRKPAAVG